MDKIRELLAKRGLLMDQFSGAVAKMGADDYVEKAEDVAEYERLKKAIDEIDRKIDRLKEEQKMRGANADALLPGLGGSQHPASKIIIPASARTGKLHNVKGENAEFRAARAGHFYAACFGSETAQAKSIAWLKEKGIALQKAHSEGSNAAGGFLVPEEISLDIIDLRDTYGSARRLLRSVPMGRDTMTIPRRASGLRAYPVGEAAAATESTMGWNQVRLTASKWAVLALMSSELDEDAAVNIGDIFLGEIAYALALAEDESMIIGDGTGTYHGITGFNKIFENNLTFSGAVAAASGHNTFPEIDQADLNKLMGTLPIYAYRRGRVGFVCSQMFWTSVLQRLVLNAGGISKDDITGEIRFSYLGFPVEIHPTMPAGYATDYASKVMCLFGDPSLAATMGDRRGIVVARSTEYKFAEDQIAIKATERFDINVHDVGDAVKAGPVVALIGTA